jgi:hypothetical protein
MLTRIDSKNYRRPKEPARPSARGGPRVQAAALVRGQALKFRATYQALAGRAGSQNLDARGDDGKRSLCADAPARISEIDFTSKQSTELLNRATGRPWNPRISPASRAFSWRHCERAGRFRNRNGSRSPGASGRSGWTARNTRPAKPSRCFMLTRPGGRCSTRRSGCWKCRWRGTRSCSI